MSMVYDWIKNIVFLYLFITALLHLLPRQDYRKYVRFFSGILIVVLLMTPVFNIIFNKDQLLEKISFESFWQEMDNAALDVEKLETMQQVTYLKQYEKAIGEDIKLLAQEDRIYVNDIRVTLAEDYNIASVEMDVSLLEESGIFIEKVRPADNSDDYSLVREFKEKLSVFYKVEDEQIKISVQNG